MNNGVDIVDINAGIASDWTASRWHELIPWHWAREPAIWRRVEVPVTASLKMPHDIGQAAIGWENSHLWHFEAGDRRHGVLDPKWPVSGMGAAKNVKLANAHRQRC